jgi:methylated-DNA-[protein]-cysteine S-methyltransferase
MTRTLFSRDIESPVGLLRLVATDAALIETQWPRRADFSPPASASRPRNGLVDAAARQLDEYFAGKRTEFDVPIEFDGTDFQRAVWTELQRIPFGETRSYSQIASRVRTPAAVRAVGAANGANPIAIIVPCHRVIGANGTLTGYGGGLPMKRWLLHHEARIAGTTLALMERPQALSSTPRR